MHTTGVESEDFEALVCIVRFSRDEYKRRCCVWVVSSGLFKDVVVGGGGGPVGCGHMGDWVCLGYSRDRHGGVGCRVEAMGGWG